MCNYSVINWNYNAVFCEFRGKPLCLHNLVSISTGTIEPMRASNGNSALCFEWKRQSISQCNQNLYKLRWEREQSGCLGGTFTLFVILKFWFYNACMSAINGCLPTYYFIVSHHVEANRKYVMSQQTTTHKQVWEIENVIQRFQLIESTASQIELHTQGQDGD